MAQAVAQQASGSWETLATHATVEQLLACVQEDMLAQEAAPREALPTVRALVGERRARPITAQLGCGLEHRVGQHRFSRAF